jgi:hypothetical protein
MELTTKRLDLISAATVGDSNSQLILERCALTSDRGITKIANLNVETSIPAHYSRFRRIWIPASSDIARTLQLSFHIQF